MTAGGEAMPLISIDRDATQYIIARSAAIVIELKLEPAIGG
jgi:hypothetical protein